MSNLFGMYFDLFERGMVFAIIAIVIGILVAVGLFFLFRFLICWYFKINQHIKQMKEMNQNLMRIASALERGNQIAQMNQQAAAHGVQTPASAAVAATAPVAPTPVPQPAASAPAPQNIEVPKAEPVFTAPVKRVCKNCGTELVDNAPFCIQCGTKADMI